MLALRRCESSTTMIHRPCQKVSRTSDAAMLS